MGRIFAGRCCLQVAADRAFCNKLWQAVRFGLRHHAAATGGGPLQLAEDAAASQLPGLPGAGVPVGQRWLLSRLAATAEEVEDGLDAFNFAAAHVTTEPAQSPTARPTATGIPNAA